MMLFIIIFVSVFLGIMASYGVMFVVMTNEKLIKAFLKRYMKIGFAITEEVQNEITEGLE